MVKELKGAQALIKKKGDALWVKMTQVLGEFDGETRNGRIGLLKNANIAPTLVKVVSCNEQKCFVQNYHDGDDAAGFTVFANQVSMASPRTLRGFRKKSNSKTNAKEKRGSKQGSDFNLQEFLKTQAEHDEARNAATMTMIEKQSKMMETMAKNQNEQIAMLIAAMSSAQNAGAGTSTKEKGGISKNEGSADTANDDG